MPAADPVFAARRRWWQTAGLGKTVIFRRLGPIARFAPTEKNRMKLTAEEFRTWDQKCITLLGMSGVGKTQLSNQLRRHDWFHYSGDYRLGTHYLDEAILDNIKHKAMQVPFLRDLLRSDSIYISNNITVDNLTPVSSFLGQLGNPELGGLNLSEFKRRQKLHLDAEIAAMWDVPRFISKAREIYGYSHFINDAGGSISDLNDPEVIRELSKHTLILYIAADESAEQRLIDTAQSNPKPLYFRSEFLDECMTQYLRERRLEYIAMIDPDDFSRWIVPHLIRDRRPRYEAIAHEFGYTVSANEVFALQGERDFVHLVESALGR